MVKTASPAANNHRHDVQQRPFFHGFCGPSNELFVPNIAMWKIHNASIPADVCCAAGLRHDWFYDLKRKYSGKIDQEDLTAYMYGSGPCPNGLIVDAESRDFRRHSSKAKITRRAGYAPHAINYYLHAYRHVPWFRPWLLMGQDPPATTSVLIASLRIVEIAQRAWNLNSISRELMRETGLKSWSNFSAKFWSEWISPIPVERRAEFLRYFFGEARPDGIYQLPEWIADLKQRRSRTGLFRRAGSSPGEPAKWQRNEPEKYALYLEIRQCSTQGKRFIKEDSDAWRTVFGPCDDGTRTFAATKARSKQTFERMIHALKWSNSFPDGKSKNDWTESKRNARKLGGPDMEAALVKHVEGLLESTAGERNCRKGIIWESERAALFVAPKRLGEFRKAAINSRPNTFPNLLKKIAMEVDAISADAIGEDIVDEWMWRYVLPAADPPVAWNTRHDGSAPYDETQRNNHERSNGQHATAAEPSNNGHSTAALPMAESAAAGSKLKRPIRYQSKWDDAVDLYLALKAQDAGMTYSKACQVYAERFPGRERPDARQLLDACRYRGKTASQS